MPVKFITQQQAQQIRRRLTRLYGDRAPQLTDRFFMMLGRYGVGLNPRPVAHLWDENDCVLITYAHTLREEERVPLRVLQRFAQEHLRGLFRTIHLLPFYPWSSDDGFSVIDYRKVDPTSGTWADVEALGQDFSLMFDLVLNHCSSQSEWFKQFVTGVAPARWYFLPTDPQADLSAVVRPRSSPLLTRTPTRDGPSWVWTTFSADQVDLNWANPDVLFEFLDILFLYLSKGMRIVRLDAIAFLWKRLGTASIHLPETHEVVKLLRDVVEVVAPGTILLTETNVPHEENISYFGERDEAHMVYNFSLPPLLLYALLREDSTLLTEWAQSLPNLPPGQTFLNFTASHDGIGVRPLQGLLSDGELDWLVGQVRERGGRVSMRALGDGSERPYELNITYKDALSLPGDADLSLARFLCSQAVMLSLRGVPAVYIHSLLGTPNWTEGFEATGHNRTLNRRTWAMEDLDPILADKNHPQAQLFTRYQTWLRRRSGHPALHPDGTMEVLNLGPQLFAFIRQGPRQQETLVCVFNFTRSEQKLRLGDLHPRLAETGTCREVLRSTSQKTGPRRTLTLGPFEAYWFSLR